MNSSLEGCSWFKRRIGFALNEGATPFNMTVFWGGFVRGFYIYLFGLRISRWWKP